MVLCHTPGRARTRLAMMSCVGEAHPEFESKRLEIEEVFGVRVELRSEKAMLCSYDSLSHSLGFCGADVLWGRRRGAW